MHRRVRFEGSDSSPRLGYLGRTRPRNRRTPSPPPSEARFLSEDFSPSESPDASYFRADRLSPRRIWSIMSRTALSMPTRMERETMLCPMFSSSMWGMLDTYDTFW